MCLGKDGRADRIVDSAESLSSIDSEIALLSPGSTPTVLHDPVRSVAKVTLLDSITNDQDGMVQLSGVTVVIGEPRVDDARGIVLNEGGIQGNREGSSAQKVEHDLGRIGSDASEIGQRAKTGVFVVLLACAIAGKIGVCRLSFETSPVHDVTHGCPWPSSLASRVADLLALDGGTGSGTVDDLLFRETQEGLSGDGQEGFDVARGGEGPARSALTLVLDGSDDISGSPIKGSGNIHRVFGDVRSRDSRGQTRSSHDGSWKGRALLLQELSLTQIGVLSDTILGILGSCVLVLDAHQGLQKVLISTVVFGLSWIVSVVSGNILRKLLLSGRAIGQGSNDSQE